jgi:O-antigen ligase
VAIWTLTPWTPGGPHPVWAYVGMRPGASTIDKSATTIEIIKLLGLGCLFLVGAATGARDDRARYAIQLTLAVGVIFGLWAFFTTILDSYYLGRRLEAHFLNANTAGTVFAVLLLLAVAELARSLKGGSLTRRFVLGSACLTFVICLFDTQSRSAVIAFLAGSFVFVALQLLTGRMRLGGAAAAVLAGIIGLTGVLVVAGDQLIERLLRSQQDALIRSEVWKIHWQAFLASPLLGYGLGTAETVSKIQMTASNYDATWNIRAILNVYLQWLEEGGLLGALPMFLCIAALVGMTARGMFRRTRMTTLLAGLLAIDAVVLVHGATDFALEVPSVAGFWAWLLGFQFSLSQGRSAR